MDMPSSWNDLALMAMGAIIPLVVNVVQALLRAAERKANSLAREQKNSDRPPAERDSMAVRELGQTFSGRVLPDSHLKKLAARAQKENGNGHKD